MSGGVVDGSKKLSTSNAIKGFALPVDRATLLDDCSLAPSSTNRAARSRDTNSVLSVDRPSTDVLICANIRSRCASDLMHKLLLINHELRVRHFLPSIFARPVDGGANERSSNKVCESAIDQ